MQKECGFCEEVPLENRTIYRDNLVWAFPTYQPIVPGHILVCPARHVSNIYDLTDEELLALRSLITKIAKALRQTLGAEGFNFAWNENEVAGQSVPHLHIHIVPRKTGDRGVPEDDPRRHFYWPGPRKIAPAEELQKIAELVRGALA